MPVPFLRNEVPAKISNNEVTCHRVLINIITLCLLRVLIPFFFPNALNLTRTFFSALGSC